MRRDFPLAGDVNTPDSLSAIIAASKPWVVTELRELFDHGGDLLQIAFARTSPVEREIRGILGPRKDFDPTDTEALMFWNTALESVMFDKMIRAMNEFFLLVSFVTLALGGIGVMNIMLITVKERTHEIGVRKALGATSRTILRQFFVEGLFLTLLSGAIGLALGIGLCALVNLAPMPGRFSGMVITWTTASLAVATLTLVGVAAATYPARRAAALPPVEALRYEQ
jgi:putative ABC transport system permease protein